MRIRMAWLLAWMLAAKRSAGVAPEVKQWIPLHVGDKAHKQGDLPCFEIQADITRSPKQGYQCPLKSIDVVKNFLKET